MLNNTPADGTACTNSNAGQDEFVLEEKQLQMVVSEDGRRSYTVLDKAAVRINVQETFENGI